MPRHHMATISFCSYLASSTPDNFFVYVTQRAKKSKNVPFRKDPKMFTSKAKIYLLFCEVKKKNYLKKYRVHTISQFIPTILIVGMLTYYIHLKNQQHE